MAIKESIKFFKNRDVKSPQRAYPYDAGIDFFVPKFTKEFIKDLKEKNPDIFNIPDKCLCNSSGITLSGTITISSSNCQTTSYDMSDKNDSIIKYDDESGLNYFLLPPHSKILIPSGIYSRMSAPGRALIAANKSGIASKYGLVFGAQVVDYTYKGEIHINVINTSTKMVRIYEDMKLIQFVETPVYNNDVEISTAINLDEFYEKFVDDRGNGGFGSSGK